MTYLLIVLLMLYDGNYTVTAPIRYGSLAMCEAAKRNIRKAEGHCLRFDGKTRIPIIRSGPQNWDDAHHEGSFYERRSLDPA